MTNKPQEIRTMPECPFSWSKKHSFEHQVWRIDGEDIRCRWCGFVDDLSETRKKSERSRLLEQVRRLVEEVEIKGSNEKGNGLLWKWNLLSELSKLEERDV